ncbi:MAG: hypothetical protein V8R40_14880 [Dysosmobacter sp.]
MAGKGDIIDTYENNDNDVDTIVIRSYTYAKIDAVDDELSNTLKNKGASVELSLVTSTATTWATPITMTITTTTRRSSMASTLMSTPRALSWLWLWARMTPSSAAMSSRP